MTRPVLHRGGYPPIDLHAIAKAMNDARAIGNPSPFTVAEGEYVRRELERFNAEHPERLPRHVCLRIIAGTSLALWLAIFAVGYFVAQLLRAVFS